MKKLFLSLTGLLLLLASCEKTTSNEEVVNEIQEQLVFAEDQCGTMGVLNENLLNDPDLAVNMQAIELHTSNIIKSGLSQRLVNGVIEIPVVFHVIYNSASENIPLSQIQEQVDALNEDFNLQNPGRNTIPSEFQTVESNIGIRFVLEDVIRVSTKKRSWRPDDSMKFSSSGGSDVVNPQEFLNVWVVGNMPYRGGNILGYAQFPGGSWATDGIVLDHRFTGNTVYSTGRTATHEVGHWLNLRHIWGDGGCGASDFVADTPDSDGPSRGCPTYPTVSCGTNDMTMNFMDYSDDPCLNMFTEGQKVRMMANFENGGFRVTMAD
ncbi:zinc metalloprotease [Robertkochia marina]|uniref:Zinc metalloprotease n=1 Tax=Robertkochia marina TaxID=1227945 RepID=A0A4S3M3Y3_9FLAO|nr:zinc metalloprotease [Robertkochia marina]THD69399.1 zinc metalloprotease [Robertkochia marina]TRZ47340.1 zinc metalloprotease [Robertkochia marina]